MTHFVVHARKAILGLTTGDNRSVPPLRHAWVLDLARAFPALTFELNGAVPGVPAAAELLRQHPGLLRGCMLGRAAHRAPWQLAGADALLYGEADVGGGGGGGGEGAGARAGDAAPPLPPPPAATRACARTRRELVARYVAYGEREWAPRIEQLEAETRHHLRKAAGGQEPSGPAVARALKGKALALRASLYAPLLNLFADAGVDAAVVDAVNTSANDGANAANANASGAGRSSAGAPTPSAQYQRRLDRSILKRVGLTKGAAEALRVVGALADAPFVVAALHIDEGL